jgi:hypothetical protein
MFMMAMPLQNSEDPSEKPYSPLQIDFVHVGGQYRVGKLLGYDGSGKHNSDSSLTPH